MTFDDAELAYLAGKKVYFLQKTNQPELDCLADDFISIDELHKLKQ